METLSVGAGDAADRWLQFSSPLCTQKAGQKTHQLLHGFCDVFWTRHAVLRLQPKSKVRFVLGLQFFYRHGSAEVPKAFMKFIA